MKVNWKHEVETGEESSLTMRVDFADTTYEESIRLPTREVHTAHLQTLAWKALMRITGTANNTVVDDLKEIPRPCLHAGVAIMTEWRKRSHMRPIADVLGKPAAELFENLYGAIEMGIEWEEPAPYAGADEDQQDYMAWLESMSAERVNSPSPRFRDLHRTEGHDTVEGAW